MRRRTQKPRKKEQNEKRTDISDDWKHNVFGYVCIPMLGISTSYSYLAC